MNLQQRLVMIEDQETWKDGLHKFLLTAVVDHLHVADDLHATVWYAPQHLVLPVRLQE